MEKKDDAEMIVREHKFPEGVADDVAVCVHCGAKKAGLGDRSCIGREMPRGKGGSFLDDIGYEFVHTRMKEIREESEKALRGEGPK